MTCSGREAAGRRPGDPDRILVGGVQAAIEDPGLLRRIMAAGTANYFGRSGDFHVEPSPPAEKERNHAGRRNPRDGTLRGGREAGAELYRRLSGFGTLLENERLIALDVAGKNVLLLFPEGGTREPFAVPGGGGVIPPHGGSRGGYHFAFSIASEDVEAWQDRLESDGVAVENVVSWPGGAKSIYFRDPDGNLAELISPGVWSIY